MFDRFITFLKNTFTYEEESQAETPRVVSSQDNQQQIDTVRRSSAPTSSSVDPGDFFPASQPTERRGQKAAQSVPRYSIDPQAAAQQQANNFSALRPRPEDTQYRMIVDKVFYAKGGGVVVRGTIGTGVAKAGANSLIVHAANRTTIKTRVIAIERDGRVVNSAPAGCTVGLLLEGITRNDVHAGDVIGEIN